MSVGPGSKETKPRKRILSRLSFAPFLLSFGGSSWPRLVAPLGRLSLTLKRICRSSRFFRLFVLVRTSRIFARATGLVAPLILDPDGRPPSISVASFGSTRAMQAAMGEWEVTGDSELRGLLSLFLFLLRKEGISA